MHAFLLMVDVTRKGQTVEIGYTLSSEERQPGERVRLARGTLRLESKPGWGTQVDVIVPLKED